MSKEDRDDDTFVVGDLLDLNALCRELRVAVELGETMGSGLLAVRGRDNGVCNARANEVRCPFCGSTVGKEEQQNGHYQMTCCHQVTEGCCGGTSL